MTRADLYKKTSNSVRVAAGKKRKGREFEPPELEEADDSGVLDELSEETGLDLSDASLLDADNVLADEESDRVVQAPD